MTIQIIEVIVFVIILVFMWPAGKVVGWLVESSVKWIDRNGWEKITGKSSFPQSGGKWVGIMERALILTVLFWGEEKSYIIIAGWLAFKVASKWATWQHIVRVPESMEGFSPEEWLQVRWAWGSHQLTRFLVGTGANILMGFFGVGVGKIIVEVLTKNCPSIR